MTDFQELVLLFGGVLIFILSVHVCASLVNGRR